MLQQQFQIWTDNIKFWVLWTHHRVPWGRPVWKNLRIFRAPSAKQTGWLVGSMGSLQTQLCRVWDTCGMPGDGCTTEAVPSTATADFRFLGIFPRRMALAYTDPHNTFLTLISMQCSICQQMRFHCFSAMTLTVHEFRRATGFLTRVLPLKASKFPVMCFCL